MILASIFLGSYGGCVLSISQTQKVCSKHAAKVVEKGIIESEVEDVCKSIDEAFENYDSLKQAAEKYGIQCYEAADVLVDNILKKLE